MAILAAQEWGTNAAMMADIAKLYLDDSMLVLDPTYGLGNFWTEWRPKKLIGSDLNPEKSRNRPADFTDLPWPDRTFDAVVFDPPYKLNGTPSAADAAYGVDVATKWQDRMALIERGVAECARVSKRWLMVKCMDQVVSGKVRWQTAMVHQACEDAEFEVFDRFEFLTHPRPQPSGRRQVHALRNLSTLIVAKRAG